MHVLHNSYGIRLITYCMEEYRQGHKLRTSGSSSSAASLYSRIPYNGTLLNTAAANSHEVGSGLGGASRNDLIALLGYCSPIVPVHLTLISASNKPPIYRIRLYTSGMSEKRNIEESGSSRSEGPLPESERSRAAYRLLMTWRISLGDSLGEVVR